MNYQIISFHKEEHYIRKFLELPGRLYSKKEIMQQPEEERNILEETHVLSHRFRIFPLLVLDQYDTPVSRCILTVYPGDTEAFLGFFESENIREAAVLLLKKAQEIAVKHNCTKITGPVDASFWIRYRFKANRFDRSYTGEPYNKAYYIELWQHAGYEIVERYYSNHYRRVEPSHQNSLFSSRLSQKRQEGYRIVSPSKATFDRSLNEVYDLLIELYRSFPAYKPISREEFVSLYGYLKLLIRYPMVKMAYYQDRAVGFFISIPDYKNAVYEKLTLPNILRILLIRAMPKSYVMLYMGIDGSHHGLGKAMAQAVKEELQTSGVPSVGALIRQGNINQHYFQELIDYEYEYVLLARHLTN
ncbi:MAG: hypothetical protein HFI10_15395 [Lachnospiraceae bacterium]|jgi:hypothetical protein|nr:hypothetical protein [Lachnospiraceae bacterium]